MQRQGVVDGLGCETPSIYGPFRNKERAEKVAARWNTTNPPDEGEDEPWVACVQPLLGLARLFGE